MKPPPTSEFRLNRIPAISQSNFVEEPNDFSLLLGGPIYQFFRKSASPAGDYLRTLISAEVMITLVAWLPLLLLATVGPLTWNIRFHPWSS